MFYKEYPQIGYYEQLKYLLIPYCAFHNTLLLALYNPLLFSLFYFIITYFLHKEKSTLSVFKNVDFLLWSRRRDFLALSLSLADCKICLYIKQREKKAADFALFKCGRKGAY